MFDPSLLINDEYREEQAKAAYYRERLEEVALHREHEVDDDEFAYFVIAWEDLSDYAQRPYRTAVATVLDSLALLVA